MSSRRAVLTRPTVTGDVQSGLETKVAKVKQVLADTPQKPTDDASKIGCLGQKACFGQSGNTANCSV
jgi:hypothetical protein